MGTVPDTRVFVGREAELKALRGLEARADAGEATVAVVTGEAGIGKTRLVWQFDEDLGVEATTVWGNCSSAAAQNLPFGPWVDVLTSLTRRLSPAFITEVLGSSEPVLASLIPALAPAGDVSGQVTQGQLFETATRLLLRTAERRLVVVVLEDLHWSDESTRGLLEYVVRSARHQRLLVVVTVRSDDPSYEALHSYISELAALPSVTLFELSRFAAEEVGEQLTGLTATDVTTDRVAEVMAFSEGVPFLVEQMVAANLEGTQLQGAVADRLLGHRIAALPDGARTVVEVAAIGHPPADVDAAARVSGLDDDAFDVAVQDAASAGILNAQDDRLAFRHALLLEAAVQRMPPRRRRRLHAGWAHAIEASPSAGDAAYLAEHWCGAGEPANALVPALRAAAEAKRLSAVAEQLRMLTEAARLWKLTPEPAEKTGTDQWAILAEAAELALRRGDLDQSDRLVAEARTAVDPDATARAAWLEVLVLWARESRGADVPIADLQAAVDRIPSEPPTRHRVIACKILSQTLLQAGRAE
jgi:predicted ATPase